jgi:hypothetical protein
VGSAGQREGTSANGRSMLTGRSHETARERTRGRGRVGADRPGPSGSGRESAGARKQAVVGRWGPPARRRRRAGTT